MPKARKPVADYITFDEFDKMLDDEQDPMMRLVYRYIWTFLLRVSEVVGQSESDVRQIKAYRKEAKAKKSRLMWTGPLPGIRPCDIDALALPYVKHSLRVFRKHGGFEVLPFENEQLYTSTISWIQGQKIKPTERLFPVYRQDVENAMARHGYTIGGQTKIHPHALRRGGGIHFRNKGGKIEVLQAVYSHKHLAQTLHYIGIDKSQAFKEYAEGMKVMSKK